LENIIILCFEKRFYKQNSAIRLKSYILTPKFLGWLATAFKLMTLSRIVKGEIKTGVPLRCNLHKNTYKASGSPLKTCTSRNFENKAGAGLSLSRKCSTMLDLISYHNNGRHDLSSRRI